MIARIKGFLKSASGALSEHEGREHSYCRQKPIGSGSTAPLGRL